MELPEYYEERRGLVMTNAENKEEYVNKLSLLCQKNDKIEMQLYTKYQVKRGLRDENGKGVLAGLTTISTIYPDKKVNGEVVSERGELRYRGIDINELVEGFVSQNRYGFVLFHRIGMVLKKLHIYYFLVTFQAHRS